MFLIFQCKSYVSRPEFCTALPHTKTVLGLLSVSCLARLVLQFSGFMLPLSSCDAGKYVETCPKLLGSILSGSYKAHPRRPCTSQFLLKFSFLHRFHWNPLLTWTMRLSFILSLIVPLFVVFTIAAPLPKLSPITDPSLDIPTISERMRSKRAKLPLDLHLPKPTGFMTRIKALFKETIPEQATKRLADDQRKTEQFKALYELQSKQLQELEHSLASEVPAGRTV